MKISRVLLDLDCVLAHFTKGCAAAWGLTLEEVLLHWPTGEYGMNGPLTAALSVKDGITDGQVVPMTDAVFWARLNGNADFWANLEPLPWMDGLIALVAGYVGGMENVRIVSSPSYCPSSHEGKVRWIRRYFGPTFNHFALYSHKEELARHDIVLIDDYHVNLKKFRAEGGHAILFAAHHNAKHEDKDDPLPDVKRELDALLRA